MTNIITKHTKVVYIRVSIDIPKFVSQENHFFFVFIWKIIFNIKKK